MSEPAPTPTTTVNVNGTNEIISLTIDPSDSMKATGADSMGTLHNFATSDGSMWTEVPVSMGGKRRKTKRRGGSRKKRRGGSKKSKRKSGKKRR